MSTFRGAMPEFPDIRIDFFRQIPGRRPPLACFLSHVHSDHLAGLETLKSPFVYCSAATREFLLRLERYPHRLNFQLGIVESRKQTYKHLKNLLKTIPLETPTRIELEPGNNIQVTLFDANHCSGAVMFLIEGDNKAVLYTGDIRSEPWFVNNLVRNPFLIEYTSGLKRLDCIYLDTSNINPTTFPTKAEGLKELLQKVSHYPADTIFHFTAWTFGYEEVWMALSQALKSQIHVDSYKMRLYQSLRRDFTDQNEFSSFLAHEGPALAGHKCGNTPQAGCLTTDPHVRLHSCENSLQCQVLNEKTVRILPIITRTQNGDEIAEIGVGGGGGDLTKRLELELDNNYVIDQLLDLFADTEDIVMLDIKRMLVDGLRSRRRAVTLDHLGLNQEYDDLPLAKLVEVLTKSVAKKVGPGSSEGVSEKAQDETLPRVIKFPYSRHSSYAELCHLVKVFNPKDVYPCTVDEDNWDEAVSMRNLFHRECSATTFRHDAEMRELHEQRQQTQTTITSQSSQMLPPSSPLQRFVGTTKVTNAVPQRNCAGQPCDAKVDEILPSRTADSIPRSTPPHEILAASPGSESQSLRRKAILEGLREGGSKRVRLQYDGPDSSSPPSSSNENGRATYQAAFNLPTEPGCSDESDEANTPSSDKSSKGRVSFSAFCDQDGEEISYDSDVENVDDIEPCDDDCTQNFTCGSQDGGRHCGYCGHELWIPQIGFCTGCRKGPSRIPYFERTAPDGGPRPEIVPSQWGHDDVEEINMEHFVGDYLDLQSSAYDSQDEEADFYEEYEIDSFIDDSPQKNSDEEGNTSSSDVEIDYKKQFENLSSAYNDLRRDFFDLLHEHEELKLEVLGSDYGSLCNDSDDEFDEEGVVLIDVSVPDPVVAELVLSQAQEQSQESEISGARIRDRVEAYEAAMDGQGWHDISMVSTRGNHTHEEIEL